MIVLKPGDDNYCVLEIFEKWSYFCGKRTNALNDKLIAITGQSIHQLLKDVLSIEVQSELGTELESFEKILEAFPLKRSEYNAFDIYLDNEWEQKI